MNPRVWIFAGCVWATLGVVLGAFGAHLLKARFSPEQLANWDTAVRYQVVHALALIAFGLFSERSRGREWPAFLLLFGSFFFSASIYALCFEFAKTIMGPITPLGGLMMIIGWIGFALESLRRR